MTIWIDDDGSHRDGSHRDGFDRDGTASGAASDPRRGGAPRSAVRPPAGSVAAALEPLVERLLGGRVPVRVAFWDGSALEPSGDDGGAGTIRFTSPDAVRHLAWSPNELGLGRAYVSGSIEIDGDLYATLGAMRAIEPAIRHSSIGVMPAALLAARRVGAIGGRPPIPPEEARPSGGLHSKGRDAASISHHYDLGNEFYELVLGRSMTYSCARFTDDDRGRRNRPDASDELAAAQWSKHELVCRKLGLHERSGQRLLDVGCGWGSMAIHAAQHHGAQVVGITISREQEARARARADEAGVGELVEIRLQDYREVRGESFDAISSIGMAEHVGKGKMAEYFDTLHGALAPAGRLLNHAISAVGGSRLSGNSFAHRYVFPDGELLDVADTIHAMQEAGFEVRDVESLREHSARTLRHWVDNLEAGWDGAVDLVGEGRARAWRLYMVGSALGFEENGLAIHQVLGVATGRDGHSHMPRTRDTWSTAASR